MDMQKIYKLFRYLLQFIFVYLILRYTPQINMEISKALFASLILIALCTIFEYCYIKVLNMSSSNDNECDTCTPPSVDAGTCKMVCSNIEKFEPNQDPIMSSSSSQVVIPGQTSGYTQQEISQVQAQTQQNIIKTVQEIQPEQEAQADQEEENEDMPITVPTTNISQMPTQKPYPSSGTTMDFTPEYLVPTNRATEKNELSRDEYNMQRGQALEEHAHAISVPNQPYQVPGPKSQRNKPMQYTPMLDGKVVNEMDYTDYDYNSLPVAAGYKSSPFDYGYSFIPPEFWTGKNQPFPPICVPTVKGREPVLPALADGTGTNYKDFYYASRFTGPQSINTEYIDDVLNSAR
jgi:hypothetical protein